MTQIQDKARELLSAIVRENYYIAQFENVLLYHGMTMADIADGKYSDKKLVYMVHDFWTALPDSPSIRRVPFFQVCEIAENIFDIEE